MKQDKYIYFFLLTAVFLFFGNHHLTGQSINIDSAFRIAMKGSSELYPAWSADGKRVVFQSNRNGTNNLFIYDFVEDTLRQLTFGEEEKQHPVFIPKTGEIAYDLQNGEKVFLFKIDPETGRQDVVFRRKIFCREASFSPSGRLMVFTGYDRDSETWQIFSYDFVYDNLNQLTRYPDKNVSFPRFSPDGKIILFGMEDKSPPFKKSLKEINWYGDELNHLDSIASSNYCWSDNGFRILYEINNADSGSYLASVRKNGSSKYILEENRFKMLTPAVSPDGSKIALAVKFDDDFDIIIVNLTDD